MDIIRFTETIWRPRHYQSFDAFADQSGPLTTDNAEALRDAQWEIKLLEIQFAQKPPLHWPDYPAQRQYVFHQGRLTPAQFRPRA